MFQKILQCIIVSAIFKCFIGEGTFSICKNYSKKCLPTDTFHNSTAPLQFTRFLSSKDNPTVKCCLEDNHNQSIHWFYQENVLKKDSWKTVSDDNFLFTSICHYDKGKVLMFIVLEPGIYYFKCQAKNEYGTVVGAQVVEMCGYAKTHFDGTRNAPEKVTAEGAARIEEYIRVGETGHITCNARIGYNNEGSMYWSRKVHQNTQILSEKVILGSENFSAVHENSTNGHFVITTVRHKNDCGLTMRSDLIIRNIQTADFATYICNVENKNGKVEFEFPIRNKDGDSSWKLVVGLLFGFLILAIVFVMIVYKLRFRLIYGIKSFRNGHKRQSIVVFHRAGLEDDDIELVTFLDTISKRLQLDGYSTFLQYKDKDLLIPELHNISNSLQSQPLTVFFITENSLGDSILNFAFDEVDHFENRGLPMLVLVATSKTDYKKQIADLIQENMEFYSPFFNRFKSKYRSRNIFEPSKCYFCSPKSSNICCTTFEINDIVAWIKYHSYQKESQKSSL